MKLKEIPKDTVVHTPTEEEAKELLAILHENGYRWNDRSALNEKPLWCHEKDATCYNIRRSKKVTYASKNYYEAQGEIILTLAEFKERYCEEEKPQPKFKVGDWVIHNHKNCEVGQIVAYFPTEKCCYSVRFGKEYHNMAEHQLLPYTEPETKPTVKEAKESEETFASEELNLCELLKGHEDELFYSPYHGKIKVSITPSRPYPLQVGGTDFKKDGRLYNDNDCMPTIFPSRALYEQYPLDPYTAWMKWREEQKSSPAKVIINKYNKNGELIGEYYRSNPIDFHTPANRDKCIEEINAIIEKYRK